MFNKESIRRAIAQSRESQNQHDSPNELAISDPGKWIVALGSPSAVIFPEDCTTGPRSQEILGLSEENFSKSGVKGRLGFHNRAR
ncbi:hypothetical protein L596_003956 [Steinernema carpocapsae]|uniref:Uncharacterized protein n=1 Tax=Steinernema carpocapsae TaxID=34508 RepID=A0A4U8UVS6_STECR|nr:hypothetical protein L596_003956 [Steinernema carpocapsae]